jgi:hypothetical protein
VSSVAPRRAIEIAAGEGSIVVGSAQFEGGTEGLAREVIAAAVRGNVSILFE